MLSEENVSKHFDHQKFPLKLGCSVWKQFRGLSTLKMCSYQMTAKGGTKSRPGPRLWSQCLPHAQSHLQLSCLVLSVTFRPDLDIWEEPDPGPPLALTGSPHISPAGLELLLLWWGQMDVKVVQAHRSLSARGSEYCRGDPYHGSQKFYKSAYYCVLFTKYICTYIFTFENVNFLTTQIIKQSPNSWQLLYSSPSTLRCVVIEGH